MLFYMVFQLLKVVATYMNKSVTFGTFEVEMTCATLVHTVKLIAGRLIGA